ncbi:MAG: hypothetical protein K9N46_07510 [Candidatus Marinimicrobia bacterium]|nr:hypothetical protein [Candidatus Neomarinimicrobiota bacterium]MCF7880570.1 hypothetical protein [Candidatus Neomarinimicrobiota bacterium]
MSSGAELLLVLGALTIFSLSTLNINAVLSQNNEMMVEQEYSYAAIALGQSYIDSFRSLAFDEATLGGTIPTNIPNDFSNSSNFGGNGEGEDIPDFDDFDDYDEYQVADTTQHGVFQISVDVIYVDASAPDLNAGTKTSHKRMFVTIDSPYLNDTITLSYMKSYYQNL